MAEEDPRAVFRVLPERGSNNKGGVGSTLPASKQHMLAIGPARYDQSELLMPGGVKPP